MKQKLTVVFLLIMFLAGLNSYAETKQNQNIIQSLEKVFNENFKKRKLTDVTAKVSVLQELDSPKGFYFVKVKIDDKKNNRQVTQYVISDGNYLLPDVIDLKKGSSLLKDLTFKYEVYDVDTKNLSLIGGKKDAKNVIVKVSDFQCPFCNKGAKYLKKKLEGRDDYALYMLNLPLAMHNQSMLRAKVLEAGLKMGKNFSEDLYDVNKSDEELIKYFAEKTGDPEKFKELVNSKEIEDRVKAQMKQAEKLGISSTPVFFINGKKIPGFNPQLIDKAINNFKK
jgi:glutaredoxin